MGDAMVIDSTLLAESSKKSLKRKGEKLHGEILSEEEKERKIESLNEELKSLFKYFKEVLNDYNVVLDSHFSSCLGNNVNGMIALLLEENTASYSKLANEVYERVKKRKSGVTIASVKSSVLYVGQRLLYGVPNADADVLEDETDSALWCWETRDMKLLPNSIRGTLKIRRTCRKKINERITAILAVISAMQKPENHQSYKQDLMKAFEKLNKVLSEADIRLLVENMVLKNGSDMAGKEAKREEKLLIKQLEKNKREVVKEKKRMDRELQKEKLQSEKELKWLQEDADKDEKCHEKEESEMRKRLKRKQEEAERDHRRREKEEAELKKQQSIQKQALIMERFLKKSKNNPVSEHDQSPTSATPNDASASRRESKAQSVTLLMDSALSQMDEIDVEEIHNSHLNSWRCLGCSIRLRSKQHWGIRHKPKSEVIKELKLCHSKGPSHDEDLTMESLVDGWGEANVDGKSCHVNLSGSSSVQKARQSKQLLQFDKSYRPAFYGIWLKKSHVVGPRNPLKKDPDLDYDVNSDEEWEEEDPGESLSDCDKGGEESLDEACLKADEEDESDDGFFVPDGYLSENEGLQTDRDYSLDANNTRYAPSCKPEAECREYSAWIQQQKYLHNLTEHALCRNQPLIIKNLKHEASFSSNEELAVKLKQMCLQALKMHGFPGALPVEVLSENIFPEEDQEASIPNSKVMMPDATSATILDSDLPKIVSTIQSCTQGMNKVLESLQQKFPNVTKSQLRSKVCEISDFVDNRWQVKKDTLYKLGISVSPEKGGRRTRSIATFF